ncbi:MAG: hypothetical protein JWM33_3371, partial [Caulobacteraceae bacterium]|nr:hypothetical protein [Caulobacteraceae bacterium]
ALALRPDDAATHGNRGLALNALARPAEALAAFDQALALNPVHLEAMLGRLAALLSLGRPAEAADAAGAMIAHRPDLARARYGLGLALSALGRHDEAIAAFDVAVALSPGLTDAHLHRGGALYALGRLGEALQAYEQVLALAPGLEQAHYNRGKTLADLDQPEGALAAYDQAIAVRPDNPDSHLNRGATLQELGDWPGALLAYDRAIALEPDHVQAHANLAMAHLALGKLRSGFQLGEWRKRTREGFGLKRFDHPEWLGGGPISGRRLLVHAEQGLGDTLQFCRYLDLVRAAGAKAVLMCPPALKALLGQSFPQVEVVGEDEPPPDFDLHAALMSLPAAFGTELDSIPGRFPYLRADPARVEAWKGRLGNEGFKIGVAWHCSRVGASIGKSFPLSLLGPIAALPGVRLISLQKGEGGEQALEGKVKIETLGEDFDAGPGAFLDCAAVMESLDLVIAPDTALIHLAGGLDRPVWTALKHAADWRWLIGRGDTPWYRSMRLFRQPQRGDWASVFDGMRRELGLYAQAHRGGAMSDAEQGTRS